LPSAPAAVLDTAIANAKAIDRDKSFMCVSFA
jgi:hypothetical protein